MTIYDSIVPPGELLETQEWILSPTRGATDEYGVLLVNLGAVTQFLTFVAEYYAAPG